MSSRRLRCRRTQVFTTDRSRPGKLGRILSANTPRHRNLLPHHLHLHRKFLCRLRQHHFQLRLIQIRNHHRRLLHKEDAGLLTKRMAKTKEATRIKAEARGSRRARRKAIKLPSCFTNKILPPSPRTGLRDPEPVNLPYPLPQRGLRILRLRSRKTANPPLGR